MQRRQFLKAALAATVLPFVPIPAPAALKPLTLGVINEAMKRVVEKEDFMPTTFGYTPVFDFSLSRIKI